MKIREELLKKLNYKSQLMNDHDLLILNFNGDDEDWDFLDKLIKDFEVTEACQKKIIESAECVDAMIHLCFVDVVERSSKQFNTIDDNEQNSLNCDYYEDSVDSYFRIDDKDFHSYKECVEYLEANSK